MYILNEDSDQTLNGVGIFLNRKEALQMLGYLKDLLNNPTKHHHAHLSSHDYQREITLCIYDLQSIESFDERLKKLIQEEI